LQNIDAILRAAGIDKSHIVKLTVFMTDLRGFNYVNESFNSFFGGVEYPARSTVEVSGLPLGAKVEIECVAFV
jgi:2-iminobutanoate/2-iminopropanoate deaminase